MKVIVFGSNGLVGSSISRILENSAKVEQIIKRKQAKLHQKTRSEIIKQRRNRKKLAKERRQQQKNQSKNILERDLNDFSNYLQNQYERNNNNNRN